MQSVGPNEYPYHAPKQVHNTDGQIRLNPNQKRIAAVLIAALFSNGLWLFLPMPITVLITVISVTTILCGALIWRTARGTLQT